MMSIHEIEQWLGSPLFPVPCRPGTKRPMVKYAQETIEATRRPAYQALLEQSNVAIRLGEHSGGLCAIDFDDDQSLEAFLKVNPALAHSARWKGRRGAQIGVRMSGAYPGPSSARSKTEMVEVNGRELGRPLYEWRSTGNLSTVKGTHPSGCEYTVLVDNPPITLDFSQIRWPEGWPVPGEDDVMADLLQQHGEPWTISRNNTAVIQPAFFAAYLAVKERILFDSVTGQFYFYQADRGIWISMSKEEVGQKALQVARKLILDHAADGQPGLRQLLPKLDAKFYKSVIDLAAALQVERAPFSRLEGIVHTLNGMVDLRTNPVVVHRFSEQWRSRNQIPINYLPAALCPKWKAALDHALPEADDQLLLQHWGGLALLQENLSQSILILQGTGGAGKGLIANVIQQLIGESNVSELRTEHLGGRFEAGFHYDKTLLVGADVDPEFLREGTASRLKAMTGGDRLQVELKGSNMSQTTRGRWNVLITANTQLKIALKNDASAWARRLLVLEFSQGQPNRIPDYASQLIAEEGPGILNWFITGAQSLRAHLAEGKAFPVSERQLAKIQSLLGESDSIRLFITTHVRRSSMTADCVTGDELWNAYTQFCDHHQWSIEPKGRFERDGKAMMAEIHGAVQTNHLNRANGHDGVRGYRNITLTGLNDWIE